MVDGKPWAAADPDEMEIPPELNRHPDGSKDRPFWRKDSETLSTVLADMAMAVRFNLRSRRTEWQGLRITDPDVWTPVSDRSLAALREAIARQYFVATNDGARPLLWGRDAFHDTLNALCFHREIDPFEEWLDTLPPWDREERLPGILPRLFGAESAPLTWWAGRYLFLGAVQRTMEPGAKLDEMVVLIGGQGFGKSTYVEAAVPPEIPDLFTDGLKFDMRQKEQVEAVLGRAVVEVSEMAGRGRAEIENIKNFITKRDHGDVRLAWARAAEPLPRRFVMIGTTNERRDLPNDPSGNRRFVPVELHHGSHIERYFDECRDQLWAEAMAAYREGGQRANLPRDLHAAQRDRAEEHRDRDDLIEDAVDELRGEGRFKLAEIMDQLGEGVTKGVSQARIVRALKNAGWSLHRTKNARLWARDPDDG